MSYSFDKFIKDIVRREDEKREKLKEQAEQDSDSPYRKYNELYRERWQNRVKWTKRGK